MLLPPILEVEYNEYVKTQQKNQKEAMRSVSQSTKDLVNDLVKDLYGKSIEELTQDKDIALKDKDIALRESQTALVRAIMNLKDKMNLNSEQIANILGLEEVFVSNVLSKIN